MYQIQEFHLVVGGGVHDGEWWTGKKWTPAQDEAKVYETFTEAQTTLDADVTRDAVIVEVNEKESET